MPPIFWSTPADGALAVEGMSVSPVDVPWEGRHAQNNFRLRNRDRPCRTAVGTQPTIFAGSIDRGLNQ